MQLLGIDRCWEWLLCPLYTFRIRITDRWSHILLISFAFAGGGRGNWKVESSLLFRFTPFCCEFLAVQRVRRLTSQEDRRLSLLLSFCRPSNNVERWRQSWKPKQVRTSGFVRGLLWAFCRLTNRILVSEPESIFPLWFTSFCTKGSQVGKWSRSDGVIFWNHNQVVRDHSGPTEKLTPLQRGASG